MSQQQAGTIPVQFARALDALRGVSADPIAVAYSGGLDSSALLHLAHAYAQARGIAVFAFHVHHGISPNADAWLAHCGSTSAALGIEFEAARVVLEKTKSGVEAAARKLRYAALGAMCRAHGVRLMLTAHHLDDQAETVLLQLLRGSGTAGLSGMDAANAAPELLDNPDLVMARPLLPVSRGELEAYVSAHAIAFVEDESNTHPRYARNALRHQVMPALAQAFPGYQERFARSAAHAQSAQRLLTELAEQDLAASLVDDYIDVAKLRAMSLDRAYNMLRHWFALRGLRMPSTAWLTEMVAQLVEARVDAQLLVTHPDCHIRRHRDRLFITPKLADLAGQRDPDDEGILVKEGARFRWNGEASLAFPAYGGVLHIETAEQGFDSAWLRAQPLQIDFRQGGERLKPAANRPTRALKYHYQACDVPAWERARLPIVSSGKDLLFAAGIGMDCHHFGTGSGPFVSFRWESSLA
ncbi:tRNA lysidine(34) synthetase TilS [Massilia sp. CF038]|uniref:tRNA lysidine(34) synthetase TilS n=1 Tax=Massilia sp. CF038 TaxID=1881045 RepID=UPI000924858B|nr:tRNA lysidine(34) synthetase TilS [Massilia sp. CF038]SHH01710.1 tRNA(Ile)-lysidine synthase [Massilia sp. CF038]